MLRVLCCAALTVRWALTVLSVPCCAAVVGFYDAVREFIVYRLSGTFEKVSTASLGQALRLEGTSVENLVRPVASTELDMASALSCGR